MEQAGYEISIIIQYLDMLSCHSWSRPGRGLQEEDDKGRGGLQEGRLDLHPHSHGDSRGLARADGAPGQEAGLGPSQAHRR